MPGSDFEDFYSPDDEPITFQGAAILSFATFSFLMLLVFTGFGVYHCALEPAPAAAQVQR